MKPRGHHSRSPVRHTRMLLGVGFAYMGLIAFGHSLLMFIVPRLFPLVPEHYVLLHRTMLGHGVAAIILAAAYLWCGRKQTVWPWVPKALLTVLSLAWLGSVDQIIYWVDLPPPPRQGIIAPHPQRGWTHIPGKKGEYIVPVRIDQHGLRVAEEGPVRTIRGKTRFLFLGDSLTFGFGVPARDAFCEQVVPILNRRHPGLNAVTLNAGISGYDLGQEAHFLKHDAISLDPAIVITQVCLNDITRQFDREAVRHASRHAEFDLTFRPRYWSGLHRMAGKLTDRIRFGADRQAAAEAIQHFRFKELLTTPRSERVELAWQRALSHLGSIVETCREADVPVVLLCFPIHTQLENEGEGVSSGPQQILAEYAKAEEVPYLDLLPVLAARRRLDSKATKGLFLDETHLTATGHRIVAEAIADFLETCGMATVLLQGVAPSAE
ncbi:MAG: SGNH/GDSL hydrolase family protein [Phycisphaerales bacterium]|nr:SGNH/GDSL hydrolase family protein [Phycisphaerales bacterium]